MQMKKAIFLPISLIFNIEIVAQTITASPSWSVAIPATTITEAGSNYATNVMSAVDQTLIDLRAANNIFTFTISVHKLDTDWDNTLSVWVQRTGEGISSGGGTVSTSGGLTYQQVTNSTLYFFSGTLPNNRRRRDVPIQYEIRGLSVLIPVKTYSTSIIYTVSE